MKTQHNQKHKEYILTLTILSQCSKFHSVTFNIQYPFQYVESGFIYLLTSFYCITALNVGFDLCFFFFFFMCFLLYRLSYRYTRSSLSDFYSYYFFSEFLTFSYFVSLSWKFSSHFSTSPLYTLMNLFLLVHLVL